MIENIAIPEERIRILRKDAKWKDQLKKIVDVKIQINHEVSIDCDDPLLMLRLKEVIKAFARGFDFNTSLNLIDEEYFLEILDVKGFSKKSKNRQITLKGRVIGKKGKSKNIIEKYTETKIAIYGKTVSIIGKGKNVKVAMEAVEMLLNGANHSTVYHFLEGQRVRL
jgi:ribosomal RNA assembly protein